MSPTSALLLALAATAGTWDLWRGRIPNPVSYTAAVAGVALAAIESGTAGAAASLIGLVAALAGGLPLFLCGAMGGGDVKLLAAIGAVAGPALLLRTLLAALVIGAAVSVVWLAWRKELRRSVWSVAMFFATALTPRAPVVLPRTGPRLRFGACIAAATVGLVLASGS